MACTYKQPMDSCYALMISPPCRAFHHRQPEPSRQLESSAEQLEQYKKASAEFQQKFIRERNVRRKLHEQLQVLKGNIRVVCR